MHANLHRRNANLVAILLALYTAGARAEAPILVPPAPRVNVTPVYPDAKKATAESAHVVVTVTIDRTGAVADAVIATSAGPDFDAAALEAARRLSFTPATRDGAPVPARIPYAFDFAYQAPPPPPPPGPRDGALRIRLRTPRDEAILGATVTVTLADGKRLELLSDEGGVVTIDEAIAGAAKIDVRADGLTPLSIDEVVVAGVLTELTYRPLPLEGAAKSANAPQRIDVEGERPAREVTRRELDQHEIRAMPGTNGDALRSLESMPGVARSPGLTSQLVVRGSGPNDTAIFVDGTQVPIAYHFGGLTSVVPTEVLSRIDFTPGNFGAEYGRAMGGIVDVGLRSPRKDRWGGLAQVDLLDGRLLAEGPVTEHTRVLVAARRSWVDAWFGPVVGGASLGVTAAPVYADGQAILEQDLGKSTTARLAFLGSTDRLALVFSAPQSSDPISGVSDSTDFYRLQLRTDTRLGGGVRWLNTLAYGTDKTHVTFGDNYVDVTTRPLSLRSDLRAPVTRWLTAIIGIDANTTSADVAVKAPPIPVSGVNQGPFFARPANLLTTNVQGYAPGAYAMMEIAPIPALKLLPSVRVDRTAATGNWSVDPRFALRGDVHSSYPRSTLKAGLGMYHQPPQPAESAKLFGNVALSDNRAVHASAGLEQELTRSIDVSAEAFYKHLDDLVVQVPDNAKPSGVDYTNAGSGRVYGAEVLLRYKADERFFGWIAYTLSRSERRDSDTQAYYLYEYDQTHILTVLGSYRFGQGWEVGARFRYVTGDPYTPVVAGVLDADAGAYSPINGAMNTGRDDAFHELDLRVEKKWQFTHWSFATYLDVRNVYSRRNPEGRQYNFNYTQSTSVAGLPILPVLGVRGEL